MTDYKWLFDRNSDDPSVVLLKIEHDSWQEPIRLASSSEDVVSGGEIYKKSWFRTSVLNDNGETPRATIEIPNVHREIGQMALALETPPSITMFVISLSDPDTPKYKAQCLKMLPPTVSSISVTAELSGIDYGVEPLGTIRVIPSKFQAMFR